MVTFKQDRRLNNYQESLQLQSKNHKVLYNNYAAD